MILKYLFFFGAYLLESFRKPAYIFLIIRVFLENIQQIFLSKLRIHPKRPLGEDSLAKMRIY